MRGSDTQHRGAIMAESPHNTANRDAVHCSGRQVLYIAVHCSGVVHGSGRQALYIAVHCRGAVHCSGRQALYIAVVARYGCFAFGSSGTFDLSLLSLSQCGANQRSDGKYFINYAKFEHHERLGSWQLQS